MPRFRRGIHELLSSVADKLVDSPSEAGHDKIFAWSRIHHFSNPVHGADGAAEGGGYGYVVA